MITISLAMSQDKAIALLEAYTGGDFTFKYVDKTGIKLKFEVTGDAEGAVKKAKELIKAESWGANLYFSASVG